MLSGGVTAFPSCLCFYASSNNDACELSTTAASRFRIAVKDSSFTAYCPLGHPVPIPVHVVISTAARLRRVNVDRTALAATGEQLRAS